MTIIETLVPVHQRLSISVKHFKQFFPFNIEPAIYHFANQLSKDYQSGYWQFYTLSNGGFYMAPDSVESFTFVAENGHQGQVSAEAFGIITNLYAFSHLCFSDNSELSRLCAGHYHKLRDFAAEHDELIAIFRAID